MERNTTLEFLTLATDRLGPVNALNLLKDAQFVAFRDLFKELGVPNDRIQEVIDTRLQEAAQDILKMPVPSPFQLMQ